MPTLHSESLHIGGSCTINVLKKLQLPKKPVILLHGASFSAQTWNELGTLRKLSEHGHPFIALDMPGFGQSPSCDTPKIDILHFVVTELGLDRPIFIGPSRGGRYSLEFTFSYPDLVGGLVLLGAVGVEENRDRFKDIQVPCCLVWGSEDTISPPVNAEFLHQEIPTSTLHIIAGASHPCYLNQPQTWHRELLNFLQHHFS